MKRLRLALIGLVLATTILLTSAAQASPTLYWAQAGSADSALPPAAAGDEYWSALGSGTNGWVNSLAADGSGNLYVGGSFTHVGITLMPFIARWNGVSWSPLGSWMDRSVNALAWDQSSGSLYAGGEFTTVDSLTANYIAKWDGASWSTLGTGMNDIIHVLAIDGNGNLYAGGRFTSAGGASADYIAMWDGTKWSPLGSGMNDYVWALAVDGSGNLYAGGSPPPAASAQSTSPGGMGRAGRRSAAV